MNKTTCPLNNVKKNTHKFYDMTNLNVYNTCKRVNNDKKSAVKDHCLFFNHVGSFEDFSILTYESNPFKLLIKEALLVSRDKPLLNKHVKSIPLQLF